MKYFIKDTRTEVKAGQLFKMTNKENTPYGECTSSTVFTLTEENIALLVKEGILIASEVTPISMEIAFYWDKLSDKLNWKHAKFANVLGDLIDVNPSAVFSLLVKEIAIVMDKRYPDHIKNSDYFYFISLVDGKVHRMEKAPINTNNVSLFRTQRDAEKAIMILSDLHKLMFPELYGKQKD